MRYLIRSSHKLEYNKEKTFKIDGIFYKVKDLGGIV